MFKKFLTIFIISILMISCFNNVNAINWNKKDTIITATTVPTGLVTVGATGLFLYKKFKSIQASNLEHATILEDLKTRASRIEQPGNEMDLRTVRYNAFPSFTRIIGHYGFSSSLSMKNLQEFRSIIENDLCDMKWLIDKEKSVAIDKVINLGKSYINERDTAEPARLLELENRFLAGTYDLHMKWSLRMNAMIDALDRVFDFTRPVGGR